MKLSLKEARRLERRIQEKGLRKGHPLHARVNIFNQDILPVIEKEIGKVERSVFDAVTLIRIRSTIRRLIQQANETSGINDLISQREEYINLLNIWEDVRETGKDIKDIDIVVQTVKNKRRLAESGNNSDYYSPVSDTVEFTAITDELRDTASGNVRTIQRTIDTWDDQLAALNATTKIEISEEMYSLLVEQEII